MVFPPTRSLPDVQTNSFITTLTNSKIELVKLGATDNIKILNTSLEEAELTNCEMVAVIILTVVTGLLFGVGYLIYRSFTTDKERVFKVLTDEFSKCIDALPSSPGTSQSDAHLSVEDQANKAVFKKIVAMVEALPPTESFGSGMIEKLPENEKVVFNQFVEKMRSKKIDELKADLINGLLGLAQMKGSDSNLTEAQAQKYKNVLFFLKSDVTWETTSDSFTIKTYNQAVISFLEEISNEEAQNGRLSKEQAMDVFTKVEKKPLLSVEVVITAIKAHLEALPDHVNFKVEEGSALLKDLIFKETTQKNVPLNPHTFSANLSEVAKKVLNEIINEKLQLEKESLVQIAKDYAKNHLANPDGYDEQFISLLQEMKSATVDDIKWESSHQSGKIHWAYFKLMRIENQDIPKFVRLPGESVRINVTLSDLLAKVKAEATAEDESTQQLLTAFEEINLALSTLVKMRKIANTFWPGIENYKYIENKRELDTLIQLETDFYLREAQRFPQKPGITTEPKIRSYNEIYPTKWAPSDLSIPKFQLIF